MKKRIFASVILALILLPALCLPIFAEEIGTAFPFSKFNGNYYWITSAYPAWERDFRDKGKYELQYTVPVYIHVNKYDYTKVEYELFNRIDSTLAEQSAKFDVYVTDGLWDNRNGETYPKVSSYDIQFETDHDDVNGRTKSQTMVGYWREEAAKGLNERETGVREVIEYGGGWLYKYSTRRFNYADEVSGYHGEYRYMRPIPEIPGTYIVMTIRFSAVKSSLDYDDFNEAAVRALEQKWTERFFNTAYRITWNDDYWDYTMSSTPQSNTGVTQNAEENPGEDGGVSVPAAIVIGVLGGGAAIAGAAAASGGDAADDKKKKQKSYKMYVQKDFGDAIRRGGDKPVMIRARMAEVDESGVERDRNDLTGNIGVSADGMSVHGVALAGRYCEATVSVPENNQNDTASITFTYMGEGGSFTNTVIFRLVDGPQLKFVDERDGTLYHNGCGIDAIPGDGFTYTERFMIVDAPVAPKLSDITAVNTGEFDVEFALTDQPALYKMTVKNNTAAEEEHDIFEKPKDKNFEINVIVEGEKKPVKGYVTVTLYPEGITISSTQEGKKNSVKYVRVQAYEKDYAGDLDKKWQVSEIKFTLAVKGEDKAIIDPKKAEYRFEKIKGSGGLGMRADKEQTLAEKYEYKESWGDWNDKFVYTFEPGSNLAEPEDGTFMMVLLPADCEYDGKVYEAEIPLRLRGKDPDPMGDWEKEYKALQQRILKFSIPENIDKWIAQLKECATEPRASVEEMRLVGKWILREYMEYWTTEQSRDQTEATMYNVIVNVLEWTKFAGDCAFSFLVNAYAGPVADALISPAKDFITGAIGEVIAARSHGDEVNVDNFEFSKNLAAAGDNLVSNAIDLKDWKKAAATLGGYFCYCAVKNYLLKLREKNESDIWGALCDAFKDMTAAALKSKAGDLIGKWLKESKKFQDKIGPFITKYFKESNFDTLQKKLNDSLGLEGELRKLAGYANDKVFETKVAEVVEKYISGLVGAGFDKVREVYDGSKFVIEDGYVYYCFNIDLFDAFHYGIKLNLTRTLQTMSGNFFGWFYDFFFAGVPAAESVIEKPKDPPLLPAKN